MGTWSRCCIVLIAICTIVLPLARECEALDELNVFIIPHSHCDPGWLNTFEGYFTQQVNRILTGVVDQLSQDASRRFSWAEISFFSLWWEQQNSDVRAMLRRLIKNKQFEFVAGGWVQNDEANANFDIVVDQVSEGHDYIIKNFGEAAVPRVAWQIDPFGHSSLTPSLFARMGFQALVINRIHYDLKAKFKDTKQMEFEWKGSKSLQTDSSIFTHVLHTHYSAPQGFDWEEGAPQVSERNVEQRSQELVRTLQNRAAAYRTGNLLVPFGDDFKFQQANMQFRNMDQIIAHINGRSSYGVKIRYATVSEYFDAVFEEAQRRQTAFPLYEGDFFPYADNSDSYWTGYYTTRPTLKAHSRGTDSVIRSAEVAYALGRVASKSVNAETDVQWEQMFEGLRQARRDAALVQHHDGITGTAKGFVAGDYAERLNRAVAASEKVITQMVSVMLSNESAPALSLPEGPLEFAQGGSKGYAVVLHNSLGWARRHLVSLLVSSASVMVTNEDGAVLDAQVAPYWDESKVAYTGGTATSKFRVFFAVAVPAVGCATYFILPEDAARTATHQSTLAFAAATPIGVEIKPLSSNPVSIQNDHVMVEFDQRSGLIKQITSKDLQKTVVIDQELMDYHTTKSGAYIFRSADAARPIYSSTPQKTLGQHDENELNDAHFLDVTYSVLGRGNKETIVRYSTDLKTNDYFFTDNGLEIRQRKSEKRSETSYYPTLSTAYIVDTAAGVQLSVLSRHAMGSSSRGAGVLEQMMHRNLLQDDGRGLAEPNKDDSRVSVHVKLLLHRPSQSTRANRRHALMLQHPVRALRSPDLVAPAEYARRHNTTYAPLATELPHNIHLLSLKARDGVSDDVIIRFAHTFETEQDALYSKEATLQLEGLFQHFRVTSIRERSLALSLSPAAIAERKAASLHGLRLSSGADREKVHHESGVPPNYKTQQKGESQNTMEEGVFISQAALDKEKERLKELEANKEKGLDQADADNQIKINKRSLLALSPEFLVPLRPMDMRSFYITLEPAFVHSPGLGALPDQPEDRRPVAIIDTLPPIEPDVPGAIDAEAMLDASRERIGDVEIRFLLVVSVVCTVMVVGVYIKLRTRRRKGDAPSTRRGPASKDSIV